jgi:hypothetical protein
MWKMFADRPPQELAPRALLCALLLASFALPLQAQSQAGDKPELSWYGYVKLDAAWDEGLVNAGNFARWVVSPEQFGEHGHFNMTARQTRLGLNLRSKVGGATLTGRWESDFYGEGAENKNSLEVRHAYVEVTWPSGWSLLAGQAADVISPLVPGTLNYTVAWWAGNIGYRRPQLRLARRFAVGDGGELRLQAAATRTIGDDFTAADDENDVASWCWGGYLTAPRGALTLSGEAWTGANLDDYLGGIGHGILVRQTVATAVESTGGWTELALKRGAARWSAGASVDDPEDADLASGYRARNVTGWGNVLREFGGGLSAGLEVSRWETRYVGLAKGSSFRAQLSVIYSF